MLDPVALPSAIFVQPEGDYLDAHVSCTKVTFKLNTRIHARRQLGRSGRHIAMNGVPAGLSHGAQRLLHDHFAVNELLSIHRKSGHLSGTVSRLSMACPYR